MIKICVWTCDMTSRSYFGKMNSTLGSVVPLAMFDLNGDHLYSHEATTRLSDRPIWIRLGGNIGIDGVCNNIRGGASKQNNRMMKVTRLVILMILKNYHKFFESIMIKMSEPFALWKSQYLSKKWEALCYYSSLFYFAMQNMSEISRIFNWIGHRIWKKNLDGI